MSVKLISFFKGYIEIKVTGYFLERFLNLCLSDDILLFDLSRNSQNELSAKTDISSFKRLRGIARRTRTRVKIIRRYGIPFLLQRHRKRKGICVGFILFAIIIYFFSTHLMGITLDGNNKINDEVLISSLESYGVKLGTPLKEINTKILKNQLMTSNDELGWIGVSLKGSRLYLEVKERTERKDIPGTDEPCNLVAEKDGIIRLMKIRDGQTMVLVNTPVKKGDLLVSGVIDSNSVGMRYTHSYGEVYATTWYKEKIDIPLKYKTKMLTMDSSSKTRVSFLNFSVPLFLKENPKFPLYQTHSSAKEISLPLKIFPPVKIEKTEFFRQIEQNKTRTVAQAVTLGKFYLLNKVNSQLSDDAVFDKIEVSHKQIGNTVTVTLECECTENIAVKTPIDKTEDLEYNRNNYDNK